MLLVRVHIEPYAATLADDGRDAFSPLACPLDVPRTEVAVSLVPSAVEPRQVAERQTLAAHEPRLPYLRSRQVVLS